MRPLPIAQMRGMTPEESLAVLYDCNRATPEEVERWREERRESARAESLTEEQRRVDAEQRRMDALTELACVPRRYRSVAPDRRLNAALAGGRGLWLVGPVGSGKTHRACAVLRGWTALNGGGARFVTAPALLAELRATYDGDGSEAAVIGKYARCPLLVVDDLGKEAPTEWSLSKLYEIVDARWGAGLPTVVTSNQTPDELARRLARDADPETAKAVVSRLAGTCDVAALGGNDRRLG